MVDCTSTPWGLTSAGQAELCRLPAVDGVFATFTTYGARLVSLCVPGRDGQITDVVTGYETAADYEKGARFFGANVGPFANRIHGARFTIDGDEYRFTPNGNGHLLHSGELGLDSVLWNSIAAKDGVTFTYQSPDGEFGFPGPVDYCIHYRLLPGPTLRIEYTARAQKATHLNLVHHSYFNLAGHAAGSISDHVIEINSAHYLEVDADSIPTGKLSPVENTPLDLRNPTRIGDRLHADFAPIRDCGGFDQCFVVNDTELRVDGLRLSARVSAPQTGTAMEIHSSYPALQFYTANHELPALPGKGGALYHRHGSFCLEPQFFPNAPNTAHFPGTLVRRGENYRQVVEFRFSVI